MNYSSLYILSLSLLVCGGCAKLPSDVIRAKSLAAPTFEQAQRSADHFVAIGNEWPRPKWWEIFANRQLNDLIEQALIDSPNLKIAEKRITLAESIAEFRQSMLLPMIDLEGGLIGRRFAKDSVQNKLSDESFVQATINPLSFRYQLDLWGRNRSSYESALGIKRARAAEFAQAQLTLSTAIARTYFRLAAMQQRLVYAKKMLHVLHELGQVNKLRLESGVDSQIPVKATQLRNNIEQQRLAQLTAEKQLFTSQLATLLGKGPDHTWNIQVTLKKSPLHLSIPQDLRLNLVAHRPDVAASLAYAKSAMEDIKVAKAEFYPDINLGGFAGLDSVELPDLLFTPTSIAFAIGPAIQLPIFRGGRLEANLNTSNAQYDIAVENYNATILRAAQEVADGLTKWREANLRLSAQRSACDLSLTNLKLAQTNFQSGLTTRLSILESQLIHYEQQFALSLAQSDYLLAAIQMIESLGGGYQTLLKYPSHGKQHASDKH